MSGETHSCHSEIETMKVERERARVKVEAFSCIINKHRAYTEFIFCIHNRQTIQYERDVVVIFHTKWFFKL